MNLGYIITHQKRRVSQCNGNSIDIHNQKNFCDLHGILIVHWLSTGMTIDSDGYCKTLKRLRCRIQQQCEGKWSGKIMWAVQTSHKTYEALISLGFTVLPHPPCSPNLASSDYTLFNINDAVYCEKFPFCDCYPCAATTRLGDDTAVLHI